MSKAIICAILFSFGVGIGWHLKSEHVEKHTENVLEKQHEKAVKLEASHDQRKAENEQRIRSAGTTAGDCDRATANADILRTLND